MRRLHTCQSEMQRHLEVIHQAVLAASLLADGEVVAQSAGSVGTVHRVAHRVVEVAGSVPDDASALRVETTLFRRDSQSTASLQIPEDENELHNTGKNNTVYHRTVFCVTILPAEMATKT